MRLRIVPTAAILGLGIVGITVAQQIGEQNKRQQTLASDHNSPTVRPQVLAKVETILRQLERDSKAEPSPERPLPSEEVAYCLLSGLATRGSELNFTEADRIAFKLFRGKPKLFYITAGVRVAIIDTMIQDKSGSYVLRHAFYYVQQNHVWAKVGSGTIFVGD